MKSVAATESEAPSRIIHIPRRFTEFEWGGTETVIYEICRVQQEQRLWQPEIATSKALDPKAEDAIASVPIKRFNYCYPFFGLSQQDRQLMDKKGGNLFSFSLLRYLSRTPNVSMLHAHALKRLGGIVRTAARWRKIPYVVSLHGGVFDVPQAELAGMMKPIENKPEWGRVLGAMLGSRRVLEDADHVICVGKSESEQAKEELSHDRVSYLPNGVDTSKFDSGDGMKFRKKYDIPEDAYLVLCLSRIDPQKNQLCLVRAFAQLRKEKPNAHLVLIGPFTHPGYAQQIQDEIKGQGLEAAVQLIPGLSNTDPDLINAFHAANVFVLPSLHEPFGIVVLEAWSCRKPVIASRVGGLQSVVTHDETGRFFDPNADDADSQLAEQIKFLIDHPEEARRYADAGRQVAVSKYSWAAISEQLEDIYQQATTHAQTRWGKS